MVTTKVNNMADYARSMDFIVVRVVSGEAWFYGAFNDYARAARQAEEIGGHVIPASALEV